MKQEPLFSIIIPVYNREHLVSETIDSVLDQQFNGCEIIVVNDGSTDDTLKVLDKYQGIIRVISQENRGPEIARNTGAVHAAGEYLVFLDSDDILFPDALSIYHHLITREQKPAVLLGKVKYFNSTFRPGNLVPEDSKLIRYSRIRNFYSKRETAWIGTSSIVFKRSHWNSETFFKPGSIDDLDFMLRIGNLGPCLLINGPATVGYRSHAGNSIHDVRVNLVRLRNNLHLEQRGEYPGGLRCKPDRLAVIGGHIICWVRKGFKKKLYRQSLSLIISGFHAIIACIVKKTLRIFLKPKRIQIEYPQSSQSSFILE